MKCKPIRDYSIAELQALPNSYGGPCYDCDGINQPFMLTNEVWNSITDDYDCRAFICLECCAKRLKRPLELKDFSSAPINYGIFGFDVRNYLKRV